MKIQKIIWNLTYQLHIINIDDLVSIFEPIYDIERVLFKYNTTKETNNYFRFNLSDISKLLNIKLTISELYSYIMQDYVFLLDSIKKLHTTNESIIYYDSCLLDLIKK